MRLNSNTMLPADSLPDEGPLANRTGRCPLARWIGIGAFTFFLVKGLAWLVVPALLATSFFSCDVERDAAGPVNTTAPTESIPE